MEIWLDTADLQVVESAHQLGIVHGVTTNPSILAHSGLEVDVLLSSLLKAQNGPVAVQVVAREADEMIKQGEMLFALSNRFIIKIPVTREGLRAIHVLSKKGISVMATAVFDPNQCLLAARAKAAYIAPYYSHICEAEREGHEVFCRMPDLLRRYEYPSKILAASLCTTEQLRHVSEVGVDAVTLNEKLFNDAVADHPLTLKAIARFDSDWNKVLSAPSFLKEKGRGEAKQRIR